MSIYNDQIIKLLADAEKAAYNAGYNAAVKDITEAARDKAARQTGDSPKKLLSSPSPWEGAYRDNPFKPNSDSAQVFEFIRANPGKRGVEIVNETGISNKTVRTVLWRLNKEHLAVNEDGWRIK